MNGLSFNIHKKKTIQKVILNPCYSIIIKKTLYNWLKIAKQKEEQHYNFLFFSIKHLNTMKEASTMRRFFGDLDMFAASPLLRARKQPETSSYTSGILSVLMGFLFFYVFISGVIGVITYDNINSTQTETKLSGDEVKAESVFFGVRVGYLSIEDSLANFEVGAMGNHPDGTPFDIPLHQCQAEQWSALGNESLKQFDQYSLNQFFCPTENNDLLNINKVYYAPNSTTIQIYVRPCKNGPTCNNETVQKQFVSDLQGNQGSIFIVVYFLDTLISPNNKDAISRTINTDPELSFTLKRGIIATIELATYKVQTDVGYFPVPQKQVQSGFYVNSFRETSYQIVSDDQNYALIYIQMNRKFIYIERQVGKFDEMLSYAGGLFSILVGFLKIFLFSYNQYRYELMVAEGVCNNDDNGNIIRENDFSFLKYIKYTIYDWVHILFCYEIDWKDCKLVDQAREEASSHLDVTNLFRKINSFEAALQHLLDSNEKQCLALIKPHSLNQKKRDRLVLEYYSTICNGEHATTIEQYKTAQGILQFSLKIYQKSLKTNRFINTDDQVNQNPGISNRHLNNHNRRRSETTEDILQMFPNLTQAALDIELSEEMKEVQTDLAQAYHHLEEEKRQKLERLIPIKILIRLKAKIAQIEKTHMDMKSYAQISQFDSYANL